MHYFAEHLAAGDRPFGGVEEGEESPDQRRQRGERLPDDGRETPDLSDPDR